MKKLILIIPFILQSCVSRETIINNHSKDILNSGMSYLDNSKRLMSQWDTILNALKLTQLEEMDSTYVKLCNDYENVKSELYKIDTSRIYAEYNLKKSINCDTGLVYSENFDENVEDLSMEFIRSFYLLHKKKEQLVKKRLNIKD